MATGMRVMGLLLTILAMGTPSVFARRALLQRGFPGFNSFVNPPVGQTVTLFDAPGLKFTGRTEGPSRGIPMPKFPSSFSLPPVVSAVLSGDVPRATVTTTATLDGTYVNPPVTLTSTVEFPPKFPATTVHAWGGFTFPGFNFPPFSFPFPFFGKPSESSPASPPTSASAPSPASSAPSPSSRASTPSPHSSPSSPPPRASAPPPDSSASSPASPPKN